MDEILKSLLNGLAEIGKNNEEIYDTACRDLLSDAIFSGFVCQKPNYITPANFGLFTPQANSQAGTIIRSYILNANQIASSLGLKSLRERLEAFQNSSVKSDSGEYYDDFFGHINSKLSD